MLNAEFMLDMLQVYSGLGKTIHVSEITVTSYDGTPEMLEAQAQMTEALFKLWFSVENKRGEYRFYRLVEPGGWVCFRQPRKPQLERRLLRRRAV